MLIRRLEPVKVYSIKEFLNEDIKNESINYVDKIIGHLKRNKKKYLCLVITVAILLFYFSPEMVVEVLAYAPNTSASGLDQSKLDIFNDFTISILLKVYCAICGGAVAVETVAKGWQDDKKFAAIVSKYGICYAGGLLCVSILDTLRLMI